MLSSHPEAIGSEVRVTTSRRSFLLGLGATLVAAPAVVRAASLMPVRGVILPVDWRYAVRAANVDYEELTAITRKAFVPRLLVQVYESSPLLAELLVRAEIDPYCPDGKLYLLPGPAVSSTGQFNEPKVRELYEGRMAESLRACYESGRSMAGAVLISSN